MRCLKRTLLYKILIILLFVGSINTSFGQVSDSRKGEGNMWFLGLNGGVNLYWGDIKFNQLWPAPKMHEIQAGGGFVFGRKLSTAFRLSSELNFSSLYGIQEVYPDTLSFKTHALSFELKLNFNIIRLFTKKDTKFSLSLESGGGIIAWRNLLQNIRTNDTLNNLGWSNPNKEIAYYIPAGIKFEYQLSPKLSAYFTGKYNFVFSDLLDGEVVGNNDTYSYSAFGINYYFGKQRRENPKLLPYNFFEIAYDSISSQKVKKENKEEKEIEIKDKANPFSVKLEVPEKASHTGFDIALNIAKLGVSASGFFRLLVPSGFLPKTTPNENVSFTKLGYRYEYDFILPINQDSTHIPIHIKLSEIERGTFPILLEGEIVDQKGNIFPIKAANYIEIISESEWDQGLRIKEAENIEKKPEEENSTKILISENKNENILNEKAKPKQDESKKLDPEKQCESNNGLYRIQIMASKKPITNMENFIAKHKITSEIFISQADGWYRYCLYSTDDRIEAERLKEIVRAENKIPEAFVTYYENGKRILDNSNSITSNESTFNTNEKPSKKPTISKQEGLSQITGNSNIFNNNILYRIEIALGYDKPIPIYLLQNKVGKESISEFKYNQSYYYTIGEFENLEVAYAFLEYVKSQFKLEGAKIGQYQGDKRIKAVF